MFIQKLWTHDFRWDDVLPGDLTDEWTEISRDLDQAKKTVINRYILDRHNTNDYELHVFSDASMKAYGAVAFLKHAHDTSFIVSKSRVKPLKEITLPRLELLGAVIATQVTQLVLSALPRCFTKVVLWSDSQIVLHWIQSSKKLPVFVENRVRTIRTGPFTDFKYCPTDENPADLLTRGLSTEELTNSTLWSNGPYWLVDGDWPITNKFNCAILISQTDTDIEAEDDTLTLGRKRAEQSQRNVAQVMDASRFSSLHKLLRVTCHVIRFVNRIRHTSSECSFPTHFTMTELEHAKKLWIQAIQKKHYPLEHEILMAGKKSKNALIRQLKLTLDESGIIHCQGRLQNVQEPTETKYPVLLPPKDHFTKLVITQVHALTSHMGLECTIAQMRRRYWVPRIRQVTKTIIRSCTVCRKWMGRPYRSFETPPLPSFRLTEGPAFVACGVDFTGTLYYKSTPTHNNKAYICLFTCAVTRAVHLEIVTDMTANAFLRAFKRFAARRSLPRHMISDNGLTFIAGAEEIQKICKDPEVCGYLANHNVKWTFIPKRAPWVGGFYERLIGCE